MGASIHPQALCESESVGDGTRIWAFAHVLPGAVIGEDCNICDHVFIENDVIVGNRVTIKSGVQLWDGVRLSDDVFVGPNATFTNDPFPRSKQTPPSFLATDVGRGASIGANATILPGVRIGRQAMVGAGTVVTRDVPPNAVVLGNPGRIAGYVDAHDTWHKPSAGATDPVRPQMSSVKGVELRYTNHAQDLRGSLVAVNHGIDLPFRARRSFAVFGVPTKDVRGEHAHKVCQQFLVCVSGSVNCVVDDGRERDEFVLDHPRVGLLMPAMVWGTQYNYSSDAVLLVYASHEYDPDDYIRDYDDFLALAHRP